MNNFKVGDMVLVTHKPDFPDDWGWVFLMDKHIGSVCKVLEAPKFSERVLLLCSDQMVWWFPKYCIKLISNTEEFELEESD